MSIAGVRPLDWIARASAPSAVAWHCTAQSRGLGRCGAGATRARAAWRWAWERAMIMRVSARGQADGYLCARAARAAGERQRGTNTLLRGPGNKT